MRIHVYCVYMFIAYTCLLRIHVYCVYMFIIYCLFICICLFIYIVYLHIKFFNMRLDLPKRRLIYKPLIVL